MKRIKVTTSLTNKSLSALLCIFSKSLRSYNTYEILFYNNIKLPQMSGSQNSLYRLMKNSIHPWYYFHNEFYNNTWNYSHDNRYKNPINEVNNCKY